MSTISLALPAGSLQEQTLQLMKDAGLELVVPARSYILSSDDATVDARLLRAQEIARYVSEGKFDAGITGFDWIVENGAKVTELAELSYAKRGPGASRWVVAVPESGSIESLEQLEGKRIASEVVNMTRAFLMRNNVRANVEFSWGATESKAPLLTDAIVDVTETGSSLRANKLRILDTIMTSTPRLITNAESYAQPQKQERINALALALRSIIAARQKWRLEMNVPTEKVDALLDILPAMQAPDVVQTREERWKKVTTVIERRDYQRLLPLLQAQGACDILGEEISRAVPNDKIKPQQIDPQQVLFGSNNGSNLKIRNIRAEQLDFSKGDGLIPCIVQDFVDGRVLMLGYMNRDAFEKSTETGKLTFWSRSREQIWTKGESSGNYLRLVDLQFDCDADTLLAVCMPFGPTCHTGRRSCFDNK